jgi:monoamine oxidase
MSALSLVQQWAEILREIQLGGGARVAGGTDRLPRAIAAHLGERVLYGARVKGVLQDERGVTALFERAGARRIRRSVRFVTNPKACPDWPAFSASTPGARRRVGSLRSTSASGSKR